MFARLVTRRCGQFILKTPKLGTRLSEAVSTSVLGKPSILSCGALINRLNVRDMSSSESDSGLVRVQHPAPPFKGTAVINGDFKEIDLCDYKGQYLVLFFYPLDFTFVCPTEIIAFSDRIKDFKELKTAVVGVSCDSHFSHLAWINTPRKHGGLGELKYPLLSDFNKTIARDYSVLLEGDGVPLRGLFIIDPQGIVRQVTINDLPVGRSVDEVLRLVKAFQFTDKHGEVECVGLGEKDLKVLQKKEKFSVQNVQRTPGLNTAPRRVQPRGETKETAGLTTEQLERLVLLDQLRVCRLQADELRARRDEQRKHERTTVGMLEERDCIAV